MTKKKPARKSTASGKVLHRRDRLVLTAAHRTWARGAMALADKSGLTEGRNCHEVCERERVVDADGNVHYEIVCRIVCDD